MFFKNTRVLVENTQVQLGMTSTEEYQSNRSNENFLIDEDTLMNEVAVKPKRMNRHKPSRFNDYVL
jgi:hypothetical protein